MRVSARITRFLNNCRKIKKVRPQTTSEIQYQEKLYTKLEQTKLEHSKNIEDSRKQLNLQLNCEDIYECGGRVQGIYPIYFPSTLELSEKITMSIHRKNLHWKVASTMAAVRIFVLKSSFEKIN